MSNQDQMSLFDHIGELRKRIIYIFIFLIVAMLVGFFISEYVIQFLKSQPAAAEFNWYVFALTDAFKVYFQFAFALGAILTFPFAMYQIWAFVKPGLSSKERKVTLSFIPGAIFLFILGICFGYFWLFPFVMGFMTNIAARLGAEEMYGMAQYFHFMFTLVLPFGLLFQMPVAALFLTRLGIVQPILLRKIRKYAYFALFVLAALITPPELLSHLFVTVPLIVLYEISILFSQASYRSMQRQANEAETTLPSERE